MSNFKHEDYISHAGSPIIIIIGLPAWEVTNNEDQYE